MFLRFQKIIKKCTEFKFLHQKLFIFLTIHFLRYLMKALHKKNLLYCYKKSDEISWHLYKMVAQNTMRTLGMHSLNSKSFKFDFFHKKPDLPLILVHCVLSYNLLPTSYYHHMKFRFFQNLFTNKK